MNIKWVKRGGVTLAPDAPEPEREQVEAPEVTTEPPKKRGKAVKNGKHDSDS